MNHTDVQHIQVSHKNNNIVPLVAKYKGLISVMFLYYIWPSFPILTDKLLSRN
jgi:hypothetical protein